MSDTLLSRIGCFILNHEYRVVRVMNPGARKLKCTRCCKEFGMHDRTRSVIPWDPELEALYAPGGPLDPATYKG